MNIERFAGDSVVFKQFAEVMASNEAIAKRNKQAALENAYQQRARDVAATGVKNPSSFL